MNITVKNLMLNQETIDELNRLIDLDISASAAFKLARVIKELSSIIEDKQKTERKLIEKYSEKGDDGSPLNAKNENGEIIEGSVNIVDMKSFLKEMEELMETENLLQYEKIDFEDLNLQTAKIKNLIKLDFLFK